MAHAIWYACLQHLLYPATTAPPDIPPVASVRAGPLAARLQQEIQQLAERVPDAPSFAPHLTLLGGIGKPREEVLQLTEQLASQLQVSHWVPRRSCGWGFTANCRPELEVVVLSLCFRPPHLAAALPCSGITHLTLPCPSACLQPYCISFDRVSFGSIFHQCVYILCNTEQPVMAAGAAAREEFGMDPSTHYMPHLSLLYSDIGPAER